MPTRASTHTNFNPHSHKGSDGNFEQAGYTAEISIHTPTRGVTFLSSEMDVSRTNFNPHSHKGSDRKTVQNLSLQLYFNPHSHKGSDVMDKFKADTLNISIHTPTRGVTGTFSIACKICFISIHTPTRGVTNPEKRINIRQKISIHTPTRGVTSQANVYADIPQISIHTPTRGVTLLDSFSVVVKLFQSTLPQGE